MQLTRLAVYRPVIALTATLALLMFGVLSYFSLGLEDNPQFKLPIVTVTAVYPGASAETIEVQLTRRIEDAISSMGSIKTISSTSQTSVSQVVIEFTEGTDVDVAASDIQQKVSGIRRDLPAEVEEPSYVKLDLNDTPVVNLAVTGIGDADPTRLYRVADDVVRPRLEGVGGVGRVEVVGGAEPEVQVEVLPDKLRSYGLTLDDVTAAVGTQFMSTSGGQIKTGSGDGSRNTSMRIDSREAIPSASPPQAMAALGGLPVSSRDGVSTELRNVANVYLGGKEAETILRVNGKAAAGVLVYKQSSANITQTVDALLPRIEQVNGELPPGFSLELVIDQSRYVRQTVDEVQHELLLAAIITGVVLFFFLHSLRSTLIVLLAIPSSLLVALIVMQVTGLTLNGMTLIALTTAIGVLVDDSIVVLENIFSKLEHGEGPKEAAVNGRSEIGMAAIAITLVDVAVWGPIIFMTGIVGAFLRNFAVVMVAATLASLLVSFTLTPLVASRWLSVGEEKRRGLLGRFARIFEPLYRSMEVAYRHLLHWSLRHRPVVVVVALLVFSSNVFIVQALGSEFVPEGNREIVTVVGELPAGAALEAADRAAKRWEMQLLNHDLFTEVHTAFVQVGVNRESRTISITLDVGEAHTRQRTSTEIGRAAVEAGMAVAPEMRARRSNGGGGGNDQQVQVRVFGDDLTQLTAATNNAEAALRRLPELADVTNSLTAAPEVTIRPDSQRLMDLGANTQQIGTAVRVAYQGAEVGKWAEANGKERDVRVVVPADVRNRPDAVANLPLFKRGPQLITLSQVATATSELKPTKITRVNRQRVATLGAEPSGVPLGTAIEEVTATMNGLALPPATHWGLAGTSQDQVDSFAKLLIGLGLSIVLMYMVLTVLYESWLQPVLILSALPLATVGAFLGLLAFGQTLNIPSFIGIIALFGLVGKNAILLVDRTNDLRRHHGLDRTAALEQAGPSRLRPILMTSAVLILSMLPVALELGGSGSGRAPLAAVLVGGMTTSTFLSLLYVPVAYTYFDSFGTLMGRLFGWRPGRRARSEEAAASSAASAPAKAAPVAPVLTEVPTLGTAPGPVHASTLVMTPGSSQTIKLLVVDDVPSVRRGLRMRLSLESDLQVVGEAASGEEALAVVRSLQPDVILMDIEMPGLDGLVTTAAMRSVAPQTAIVTLSLHDDSASREKALAAGATAFVGKHDASEALLTAIRDAAHSAA